MLQEFYSYFQKKNICEVEIFWGNSYENIINLQRCYLDFVGKINLAYVGDGKRHYVNYKSFLFNIKSYCQKLFFSNQLFPLSDGKGLSNNIQLSLDLLVVETGLNIIQNKKRYFKNNIHSNVCQQKSFFRKAGLSIFVINQK